MTIFEGRAFKEVKIKLLDWALVQYNWCSYKRRKLGHTERYQGYAHTQQNPQQGGGCLQAKERSLKRNQTC